MKYNNKKITYFGREFDSQVEANRYLILREREKLGEITELQCQPVFPLYCDAGPILGLGKKGKQRTYTADFSYKKGWELIVEDVKPRKKATKKNKMRKDKPLIDIASSLRMSVAEACYDFKIRIIF